MIVYFLFKSKYATVKFTASCQFIKPDHHQAWCICAIINCGSFPILVLVLIHKHSRNHGAKRIDGACIIKILTFIIATHDVETLEDFRVVKRCQSCPCNVAASVQRNTLCNVSCVAVCQ